MDLKSHQVTIPDNATTNQQLFEGMVEHQSRAQNNQQAQLHPVPMMQAMPRIYRTCYVLLTTFDYDPRTLQNTQVYHQQHHSRHHHQHAHIHPLTTIH
jgi:hypothetical protein